MRLRVALQSLTAVDIDARVWVDPKTGDVAVDLVAGDTEVSLWFDSLNVLDAFTDHLGELAHQARQREARRHHPSLNLEAGS